MARYIDAEALEKWVYEFHPADAYWAVSMLKNAPVADVAEVKHGFWKQTTEPLGYTDVDCAECSVCGESWIMDENLSLEECTQEWNYCPNCGAKMDGRKQEEVRCKDCEYLMFSDCYGECSKAYKGIVSPDDGCVNGKRKRG